MATNQETLVRGYIDAVWNGRDLDRCRDFITEDFVVHIGGMLTLRGAAGVRAAFQMAAVAAATERWPERYRIDHLFTAGERVITRLSLPEAVGDDGSTRRELYAGDPNANLADEDWLMAIAIHRIRDGKIAEEWRLRESNQERSMRVRQRVDEALRLIEECREHESAEAGRVQKPEWCRRIDEMRQRFAAGQERAPGQC